MSQSKIWLSSPHMGGTEQQYIEEAFATNWVAPLGPNVAGFEHDLERYLGGGVSVGALSSGTAAIHLGLILLGVQAGDEVLCQSMTFSASANPILYLGATPVFVDSETQTWNICPVALEAAIVDRIIQYMENYESYIHRLNKQVDMLKLDFFSCNNLLEMLK